MYACTCIYPWLCTKRTHLARKNGPDLEETPGRGSWALLLNPTPFPPPPAPLAFPLVPFIRALGLPALRRIRAKEGNKASVWIRRDCLENLGILPALSPLLTPCRVGGEGGEGGGEGETVPVSAHGKFRYEANISTLASP